MATRREQNRLTTIDEIKRIARLQMAQEGISHVTLRGIAREMGMAVTALYRYFPSYSDLITELILDAFNGLADHIDHAQRQQKPTDWGARLWAALMAYRDYALTYPHDFALIYGTPIVGYNAPGERTVPASSRTFEVIGSIIAEAHASGALIVPHTVTDLPATVVQHMGQLMAARQYAISEVLVYTLAQGWSRLHGIVMLELFGHFGPVVGDVDAFYRSEVAGLMQSMGLAPPD
jgi:AcrR family transcriptional regulator